MARQPSSTELIAACILSNDRGFSKARRLLSTGAAVDAADSRGTTPLLAAAVSNSVRTCELLLKKGAEVNRTAPGLIGTALHGACAKGHKGVVQLLLGRGARVDVARSDGSQPLRGAAEGGHVDIARLLLASGADPCHANSFGDTALHAACCRGHLAMAELLIQSAGPGIVDVVNSVGETALFGAAAKGHVRVAELLLARGARIAHVARNGDTPFFRACVHGHGAVAEFLLSKGADPNHVNSECNTALHMVAYKGDATMARLLLLAGARVDPVSHGVTPLAAAVNQKHVEVTRLLLSHGAQPGLSSRTFLDEGRAFLDAQVASATASAPAPDFNPSPPIVDAVVAAVTSDCTASLSGPAATSSTVQQPAAAASSALSPQVASPTSAPALFPLAPGSFSNAAASATTATPSSTPPALDTLSPSSPAAAATVPADITTSSPLTPHMTARVEDPALTSSASDASAAMTVTTATDNGAAIPVALPSAAAAPLSSSPASSAPANTSTTSQLVRAVKQCANCGVLKSGTVKLYKCSGCQAVRYCGVACRDVHWREGGHKQRCKLLR